MNTKRIEEIQKETAYPDSVSVQQALLKVWNECEQEKVVKNNAVLPHVVGSVSDIQYCKDCVNYPCNSYEKSAKCRICSWDGRKQTKFERRLD